MPSFFNLYFFFNKKGQTTVLIPLGILMVTTLAIMTFSDFFKKNQTIHKKLITKSLLQETTLSTFAIMESALRRRMWEAPPDNNCNKSESFSVSGKTPYGINWSVEAEYDFDKSIITMYAVGKDKYGNQTQFVKQIKIMDTSDYLLISSNNQNIFSLNRSLQGNIGDRSKPTSLIAGPRRIFVNSAVEFSGNFLTDRYTNDFDTDPADMSYNQFIDTHGIIIQGERVQLTKGVRYRHSDQRIWTPNTTGVNTSQNTRNQKAKDLFDSKDLLNTSVYPSGSLVPQQSTSAAIFYSGNQQAEATAHKDYLNKVTNSTVGLLSKNQMRTQAYPYALAGKNSGKPIFSWSLTDSKDYQNDFDKVQSFNFTVDINYQWAGINASCLMRNINLPFNHCSYSEAEDLTAPNANPSLPGAFKHYKGFPLGFNQWREDASLVGSLYTSDSDQLKIPTLDWDNIDALKDDAQACGQVIVRNEESEVYEDCEVWDANFLKKYRLNGLDTIECSQIQKLRLSDVTLNNFNKTNFLATPENRQLRRVIFTDKPIELSQNNSRGLLYTGVGESPLNDNEVRSKLALWIVNTDYIVFRGHQKDLTTPMQERPGDIRQIYFNKDLDEPSTSSNYVNPVNLVVFSPERIHLISPQYVPMSRSHFLDMYPRDVTRKQIVPKRQNITDHHRYNNDAFLYGIRDFNIERVALITNSNNVGTRANVSEFTNGTGGTSQLYATPYNTANFFFKGLWYIGIYNDDPVRNLCFVWDEAHTPATDANAARGNYIITSAPDANSSLPPLGSNFYLNTQLPATPLVDYVTNNRTQASVIVNGNPSYANNMPPYGMPWVFAYQYYHNGTTRVSPGRSPVVSFVGLSMNFPFAKTSDSTLATSENLRELNTPKYEIVNRYRMDLANRKFSYADSLVYQHATTPQFCMERSSADPNISDLILANFRQANTAQTRVEHLNVIYVNNGLSNMQFESPNMDFDGLGSIAGVELPVFKTKEK